VSLKAYPLNKKTILLKRKLEYWFMVLELVQSGLETKISDKKVSKIEFSRKELNFIMDGFFTYFEIDQVKKKLFNDFYYKNHTIWFFKGVTDEFEEQINTDKEEEEELDVSEASLKLELKTTLLSKKTQLDYIGRSDELRNQKVGLTVLKRAFSILYQRGVEEIILRTQNHNRIKFYTENFNARYSHQNSVGFWYSIDLSKVDFSE